MLSGHLDNPLFQEVIQIYCPFFIVFCFFFFYFLEFFVYFEMNSDSYVCYRYLCPLCGGLPFCSHNGALWWTGAININLLKFVGLFFWLTPFVFCVRTFISVARSCSYSPMCFLWTWSFLTSRSIIYLELIGLYVCCEIKDHFFPHDGSQIWTSHLLKI